MVKLREELRHLSKINPVFFEVACSLGLVPLELHRDQVSRDVRLNLLHVSTCLSDAYRIDAVQPVDLFPHTDHVECVVRLTRV